MQRAALLPTLRGARIGGLGRNTLLTSSGLVLRAALQGVYLLVLSRWLGAEGYGLFAGSIAAAVLLAPLSGWGMGYVFTERAVRADVRHRVLWRAVASHAAVSGLLFTGVAIAASQLLMTVRLPLADMALLALAELLALPLAQVSTTALLALDRGGLAALATSLVPALRVVGVLLLVASGEHGSVHLLALSHCLGSIVGAVMLLVLTGRATRCAHAGSASPPGWRVLARAGAPYAASALASNAYFEIDKVLILQLLGAGVAGAYTAAFRVVVVFILPVMALLGNALPRMFAAERAGQPRPLQWRVTLVAVGYAVGAALLLLVLAPLVPWLFGSGFDASARYVTLLAAWVPLYALHMCGATALVAAGGKLLRVLVEGGGLALVVALNLLLLPRLGAAGAATSLLAVEIVMALACWSLLARARDGRG